MSEWAYVWKPIPGLQWRASLNDGTSNVVVDGASAKEVMDEMTRLRIGREPITWKLEPPPQPRRRDDVKPASAVIEGDVISYHAIAKRLHPDLCGKRKFTADQVMQIINELRASAAHK
jgi:hypothetical protein